MYCYLESSYNDIDTDDDDKGPSVTVVINTAENEDSSGGSEEDIVEVEDKKKKKKEEEEDEQINNGYVRVETKAVPTPQHPTMVMCSPEDIQISLSLNTNNTVSDENSAKTEQSANPDEHAQPSDTIKQPEAISVNTAAMETEVTIKATDPVDAAATSPPTTEEDHNDIGAPKGVVVLPVPVASTSTMSVVRPRSAPQSKLQRVLPADSNNCFNNHDNSHPLIRHQSQKSVPEVNPAKKELSKYSSLPAHAKNLSFDGAVESNTDAGGFTILNSFKDSREAIDEIWKSVTLEGSSQLEKTIEVATSSSGTSPRSSQFAISMSSSLAVNTSNTQVSVYNCTKLTLRLSFKQLNGPIVNGELSDGTRSPNEDTSSRGVL